VGQVTFSGERNSPLSLSFQFIPQIVKNLWGGYGNSSVQQILRYSAVSDLINSPTSSIMISYRSFLTVAMKFSALAMVSIGSDISNDRSSACSRPIYSLAILSASSPTPTFMLNCVASMRFRINAFRSAKSITSPICTLRFWAPQRYGATSFYHPSRRSQLHSKL
jgi:hypothetical protein